MEEPLWRDALLPSRRAFLKTGLAATAAVAAPGRLTAQSAPPAAKTIRAVMHGDLKILDPIWTTANMTRLPRRA